MQIQLLVDDKKGNIFDISELVSEITWKTKRKAKPSSLDFEILKDKQITINNGDVISFKVDGNPVFYGYTFENGGRVFYGYTFENGGSKNPITKITAYDQLRYLLFNDA